MVVWLTVGRCGRYLMGMYVFIMCMCIIVVEESGEAEEENLNASIMCLSCD